jgi:antigen flippase
LSLRKIFSAGEFSSGGRKVFSTGAALITAQMLLAIAGVIAARVLGPDGRGMVTGILIWTQLLPLIALGGLNQALSVRVSSGGGRPALSVALGNALAYALGVGGIVTVGAVAILPSVLDRLGPHAGLIAAIGLVTIPLSILGELLFSVNIALDRIGHFVRCRLVGPALVLTGTVVLWAVGSITPAAIVATTLIGGAVGTVLAGAGLPWRKAKLVLTELRGDVAFAIKVAVAGWLELTNLRFDLLVMSTFVPTAQIGFYGVANNAMIPVTTIAAAAAGLLTPAVARKLGGQAASAPDRRSHVRAIRREAARYGLVAALGGVLLAVAAPLGIPLVFGHAFKPAVVLIWILIPGYVIRTAASILVAGAVGMRRASVGNLVEGASLVATAALLPVLLPRYQAVGAAVTSTVAYCVAGVTALWLVRRLAREPGPEPSVPPAHDPAAEIVPADLAAPGPSI